MGKFEHHLPNSASTNQSVGHTALIRDSRIGGSHHAKRETGEDVILPICWRSGYSLFVRGGFVVVTGFCFVSGP